MKHIFNDRNKAYIEVISSIVDPLYSREIIFVIFVLLTTYAYFSTTSHTGLIVTPSDVMIPITFPLFTVLLIYSGVVAGNLGNFIGKGAEAFFLTSPVSRFRFYLSVWLSAIVFSFLLYGLYTVLLIHLLTFTLFSFYARIVLLVTLSSLALYTSTGMLISAITRNSAFSLAVVLVFFFGLSIYSSTIFPNSPFGDSFVSGIMFFSEYSSETGIALWPSIIIILLSIVIFLSSYLISKNRDQRSGRSA